MQRQPSSLIHDEAPPMREVLETLLSALAGFGIVLMLAFFLSLETWAVSAAG